MTSLSARSTILCTCAWGIVPTLRAELEALGYRITVEYPAGVCVEGTFDDCLKLNLWLRTAHRVLYRVAVARARTPRDVYAMTHKTAWEDIVPRDGYVAVISSVDTPAITNTQFANLTVKDAIVDRIREKSGARPDSGPRTDQTVVFLYWHDTDVMLYIDTSGAALSDRGYRLDGARAPLRESLAAAIVQSTRWDATQQSFVNPMGGSGTLAIEAGLIAVRRAPGSMRSNFGFMHVRGYEKRMWNSLVEEAREQERVDVAPIVCTDISRRSIEAARANARRAGLAMVVEPEVCDFRATPLPEPVGVVVINPEYGLRLGEESELPETYEAIGDWFKQECRGWLGYVFTGNMELAKHVGLRTKRRIPFWNADIECRLLEYELYDGTRKAKFLAQTEE